MDGFPGHTWTPTYANPVSANVVSFNGGGYGLQEQWFKTAEELGVSVYYDTSAIGLLQDSQGNVTGVRAKTSPGYCNFHGKAVVLACGSFESSPEMRARHLGPDWKQVKLRGVPYNTGDGLMMAIGNRGDALRELVKLSRFASRSEPPALRRSRTRY